MLPSTEFPKESRIHFKTFFFQKYGHIALRSTVEYFQTAVQWDSDSPRRNSFNPFVVDEALASEN